MSVVTIYHCSPYLIKEFNFDKGVHFGSRSSALQAGKRKLYNLNKYKGYRDKSLFLYTFELNTTKHVFNSQETDDMGNDWIQYMSIMKRDNIDYLIYRNKYEPDSYPSYYITNPNCLRLISTQHL